MISTRSGDRVTNVLRKRRFMPFTVWCSYHAVPQLVRGRKRESSPRAGAGNLLVRFDEREQEAGPSQTGLRERGESRVTYHRETKVTAPVLDSTRLYTSSGTGGRIVTVMAFSRQVAGPSELKPTTFTKYCVPVVARQATCRTESGRVGC